MVQAPDRFRFVGTRTKRADAPERLTGRTRFTSDLALAGALTGRLVRSPHASARVLSVDASAALAIPGVVRVLTARDLPVPDIAAAVEERKVLLGLDRVHYAGQPVAVVLAETEAAAEDGAAAVEVDYEPLPPVVDPLTAMTAEAPVVRERRERSEEELAMHGAAPAAAQESEAPETPNVASRTRLSRGEVEQGLREADVVVEREFRTSWVHQGYIEPQTCVAAPDPLGNLVVYACTQALFHTRAEGARTPGIPHHRVPVQPMPVGGGFGGKFGLIQPTVPALAVAAGR